jgi:anti-anti-sigma factor
MTEDAPRQPEERRQAAASQSRLHAVPAALIAQLQRVLLPATVPLLPRAVIGARYQAANDSDAAGGGWFDAIALSDGTVALIVGDVAGAGTGAAAAMGQLRAVLSDQLVTHADLDVALRRANAVAERTPELLATTMVLAQLSPAGGWLRYVTCGHPPPLLIGADGGTSFLAATGTGPLGTGSPVLARTAAIQPEDCLLLYAAGLVQRSGSTVTKGMQELAMAARGARASQQQGPDGAGDQLTTCDPDRLCGQVVEVMEHGGGHADDVTALAVQLRPEPVGPLSLSLPADESSVLAVRRAFADWLDEIDAAARDVNDLMLAVVEMVTNAVEHAYPPDQPGTVRFSASLAPDGVLVCQVSDQGRWREPDPATAYRGHGLMVAGQLVDQIQVSTGRAADDATAREPGTVVTLRHRLGRPASIGTDVSPVSFRPSGVSFGLELDGGAAVPHARVTGQVDGSSAERLAQRLLAACRGGTLPIIVDLADVTYFASSAIRAIYQVQELLTAHDKALTVVAPEGSTAGALMDVVGLPHVESAVLS